MSQLKVNSIVPSGGLPAGASGGIIQVVQGTTTPEQIKAALEAAS